MGSNEGKHCYIRYLKLLLKHLWCQYIRQSWSYHVIFWCNCVCVFHENLVLQFYVDVLFCLERLLKRLNRQQKSYEINLFLKSFKTLRLLRVTFFEKYNTLCIHKSDYNSEVHENCSKIKILTSILIEKILFYLKRIH